MNKTTYYQLNKPEAGDPLRVADFNENADKIDAALSNLNAALGSKAEQSALAALSTEVAAKGNCSIECGTYQGTGTFGADNPSTLTFGIEPKIVFIFNANQYGAMANTAYTGSAMGVTNVVFYYGGSKITTYSSGDEGTMYYTMSGNTLTWYSTQSKGVQMNHNSDTYGYIAIG